MSSNEYLMTVRADSDKNDLFLAIGKRVLGPGGPVHDGQEGLQKDGRVQFVGEQDDECVTCGEYIIYRGLSVTLPPLGDVLLISSYCGGCRSSINEPDFGSEIKGHGVRYNFRVSHPDDLERAVLKSKTATLSIGNTLYQLPPGRGRLTTIEGLLSDLVKTWENGQKQRKQDNPGAWKMIYDTVQPLISMANGAKLPFTISLDDPTGNSCIEASEKDNLTDGKYAYSQYARTSEQNAELANRKNEYDDEMEGEPYKRTAEYEDLVRAQLDDGKPLIDIKGKGKA